MKHPYFLRHLANKGATNLHPFQVAGTGLLIDALEPNDGEHILEIGCGTGGTMVHIATHFKTRITGVDVLSEMVKTAKERVRFCGLSNQIEIKQVEILKPFPFEDKSFDKAYCESVLAILSEKVLNFTLSEIHRVLKPDGLFAANEAIWSLACGEDLMKKVNEQCLIDFGMIQASDHLKGAEQWGKIFRKAGFNNPRSEKMNGENPVQQKEALLSNFYSAWKYAKWLINPIHSYQNIQFKKRLKAHENDGQQLELLLFVMKGSNKTVSNIGQSGA